MMGERPPSEALRALAGQLRDEGSVIASHVVEPGPVEAGLGSLAAAGPRTASTPGEYALIVEAVREGYLLHYGQPRLVAGADPDLSLLAGDYLYALGLERLAALGDLAAVRELADLISISAQLQAEEREQGSVQTLWLACIIAIGCGASVPHERGKAELRDRRADGARTLLATARGTANEAGLGEALDAAAQAIDFADPSG
jgi:hypothetical protein